MIPYAKHSLQAEDLMEVLRTLQGPAITQGTTIEWFEDEFRKAVSSRYAVAVNSGTAALHAALVAANVHEGDHVIVPSMTFVATANVVKYVGAIPVFADVDMRTLLIDPEDVERKITKKTKAVIAVDYAGQPADYHELRQICERYGTVLIADACHSLGGKYKNQTVGSIADFSCFSLHASKLITSGEGGVITTNNKQAADKMRAFRDHGRINGEMVFLGYNYRMTHLQAALCVHQIERIPALVEARRRIADYYDNQLFKLGINYLEQKPDRINARHIYVLISKHRDRFRDKLLTYDVCTQIHYKPVTLQPFYDNPGITPNAERIWENILTIPLYPQLSQSEQDTVIQGLRAAILSIQKEEEAN